MRFVVDTGSFHTVLTLRAAQKLKANLFVGGNLTDIVDISGTAKIARTDSYDLKLGELTFSNETFAVINYFPMPPSVDGLIGRDVLTYYNMKLDFPHNKLVLFQRGNTCFPFHGEFADAPMFFNDENHYVIEATVDQHPVRTLIDTGSRVTLFTDSSLKEAQVSPQYVVAKSEVVGTSGKTLSVKDVKLSSLVVGGEEADNVIVKVRHQSNDSANGSIIGEDYLREHQVYISEDDSVVSLGLRTAAPEP